ncbi:DUF4932 domain-containing protein [Thiospirochaeta perfilievii]|uniref:DUF4932 domain-containing protein n=1 Tax=Thiospirochaeta perfilievii TaxID=252967 RepID=A0A5C1QB62_9SPIO|nr:DUF4932 domain-containing protein [Thiospirochaeta perfilievii]QEN05363.1 DUF4932 domain-containing protein [Thiospirochaeta perfilievii]
MKLKKLRVIVILVLIISCKSNDKKETDAEYITKSTIINFSDSIYGEINPNIELLSGVLAYTSWIKIRGPETGGNKYFRDLKEYLDPYKKHDAFKIAEKLTRRGFTYDAPPNLALRLGPLPELENINGYSEYLIDRAWNEGILEDFRLALRDLAIVSKFDKFYNSNIENYSNYINRSMNGMEPEKITKWLSNFYGWSGSEFHLVFAPAMFPGGGYGSSIELDNKLIVNQVLRARGTSLNEPILPTGLDLSFLTIHELSHSFINPSNEKIKEIFNNQELLDIFNPVKELMEKQAYPEAPIFFNELLVRAVTLIALKDIYNIDDKIYNRLLESEKERGFYLIKESIDELNSYRKMREIYPRFDSYLPIYYKNITMIDG